MAALGVLCEDICPGSCASSSVWTFSGAQLLLCWSRFPCGVVGGGGCPSSATPVLWGKGVRAEEGQHGVLVCEGGHRAQRKVCAAGLGYTFSEVLGEDAKP